MRSSTIVSEVRFQKRMPLPSAATAADARSVTTLKPTTNFPIRYLTGNSSSVSHRTIEVLRLVEAPGRIEPDRRDKLGRYQIGARKIGAGDDGAGEIRATQVGARQ